MAQRVLRILCATLFLIICIGVCGFLHLFMTSGSPYVYPAWEEGWIVSADGSERAFDVNALAPALAEGESMHLTLTLPEERSDVQYLIFETGALDISATLDGEEIWHSTNVQQPGAINLSQAQVPLPAGGGETLEMTVAQLSIEGLIPPLVRLSSDPADHTGTIAYANLYGIPAGVSALALVLLIGLFLLGIVQGRVDLRLLLPVLAAAALTGYRLGVGYGEGFLPAAVQAVLVKQWVYAVGLLALILFLALQRGRDFWRTFAIVVVWSTLGCGLMLIYKYPDPESLIAYLRDVAAQVQTGYFGAIFYWLSIWLLLTITLVCGWTFVGRLIRAQKDAYALSLQNQLALENVHALERKMRENAAIQHESLHRLAALDAMLESNDLDALKAHLSEWKQKTARAGQTRYTDNWLINAILQDADNRAAAAGIQFEATVSAPKDLSFPDEDLCILLMNLLDNALEGAAHTPEDADKMIHFQLQCKGGFMAVYCENSFDGTVSVDEHGVLHSRKAHRETHGFGMAQMQAVAERYGSILDISYSDTLFTVQTALKIPKKA